MRKLLITSFISLLIIGISLVYFDNSHVNAQTVQPFSYVLVNSFTATGSSSSDNLIGNGSTYHKLVWNVVGSLSTCTVAVDSSADGSSWSAGGIITGQTCTSNGNTISNSVVANYVRITVTAISGSGSLSAILYGYVNNPAGGGGGSGTVNSGNQYQIPMYTANGTTVGPSQLTTDANGNLTVAGQVTPALQSGASTDGFWLNGLPASYIPTGTGSTSSPALGTALVSMITPDRPFKIGHVTYNVTVQGTSAVWIVCIYTSTNSANIWTANQSITSTGIFSPTAAQVTLNANTPYFIAYGQTGTGGATLTAFPTNVANAANIVNFNGTTSVMRSATATGTFSGTSCPATLGNLSSNTNAEPLILLEP